MEQIARLVEITDRQLLYKNVLYVDANSHYGSDSNNGSKNAPFLTIIAAVAAASEYTTIICVDSRVGAEAVGFDEKTAIAGVVINTNYITVIGCKLFGDRCFGKNVPITNSIADADYVFSGSGIGVVVCGFAPILANANGDEKCIYLTGDGAWAVHCDVTQSVGAHGFIGIHLTGDDIHVRRCHGRWFDNDVVRLEGCVMGHVEESLLGAGLNGLHLMTGCLGCVAEHCDILTNTVGVLIDDGATNNHICMPHFSNNGTDFTNNGGATNDVIDAHKESQIVAGQTIEQDLKDIYDKINYTEDSVSDTTANAFADALDLDYRGTKIGSFEIKNTDGANSLDYKVLERVADYTAGDDEELQASQTLAFGEKGKVNLEYAHSRIKIQVKSTVGGSHATYTIKYLLNK